MTTWYPELLTKANPLGRQPHWDTQCFVGKTSHCVTTASDNVSMSLVAESGKCGLLSRQSFTVVYFVTQKDSSRLYVLVHNTSASSESEASVAQAFAWGGGGTSLTLSPCPGTKASLVLHPERPSSLTSEYYGQKCTHLCMHFVHSSAFHPSKLMSNVENVSWIKWKIFPKRTPS